MTRRRYTRSEAAEFESRDGQVIRVAGVTLEESSIVGTTGVGSSSQTSTAVEPEEAKRSGRGVGEPDLVQEVWDHYVEVFGATRQTLNDTRRRIIRNALKVRTGAECKRAIDGLRVSPWHNGDNPERKKYLDIRYALRGNRQIGQSDEERIDTMVALAPISTPKGQGLTERQVRELLEHVRYTVQTGAERDRGIESIRRLREAGFVVRRESNRVWLEG